MTSSSPPPPPSITLGRGGQQLVMLLLGIFSVLVAGVNLFGADDVFGAGLFAWWLLMGAWLVIRTPRVGVRVSVDGITERELWRSRRVPWCDVQLIDVETQGLGPGATGAPRVVRKSGERLRFTALASYSPRVVDSDVAVLQTHHGTHLSACPDCVPRDQVVPG
ncbi:hypothetical protein ACIQUQ_34870 [Streptomyces sp. NPDC101118]|uniref:hypothetical protein n=1 Tax=Streptomyces sp. NPDC101118 TaxID=3366109 RepID=UPI003820E6B9